MTTIAGVEFAPGLLMDVRLADVGPSTPVVVFAPGGGFDDCEIGSVKFDELKTTLAQNGIACAIIEYPLTGDTPAGHIGTMVDAMYAALAYLRANKPAFHLSGKAVLAGSSAGSMVAMSAGVLADVNDISIAGILGASGQVCKSDLDDTPEPGRTNIHSAFDGHWSYTVKDNGSSDTPPVLMVHNTNDTHNPVIHATHCRSALLNHGAPSVTLCQVTGGTGERHGIEDSWYRAWPAVLDFLAACFA